MSIGTSAAIGGCSDDRVTPGTTAMMSAGGSSAGTGTSGSSTSGSSTSGSSMSGSSMSGSSMSGSSMSGTASTGTSGNRGGTSSAGTTSGGADGADGGRGGAAGDTTSLVAGAGTSGGSSGGRTGGCPAGKYPVCIDFESGALDAEWTLQGTDIKVETGTTAAGKYALHFSNLQPRVGQMIQTKEVEALPSVMWGRFYLRMTPGAPEGHGGFLYGFDQDGARWELGFEHNAFMADYHGIGTPEKPYYTRPKIEDRWLCVEFAFDGAAPADPRIWVDGSLVPYYRESSAPGPFKVTQWRRFSFGFRPSHGTSLSDYEGTNPPVATDMWMDDIALDSKRIGCE